MTGQESLQAVRSMDRDESVVEYLRVNPEFLTRHVDLLQTLHVPHEIDGAAVSLIEAQVHVLRQRNTQLHEHLTSLLDNARSNEELAQRLHRLLLSLIENPSLDEIFTSLYQGLEDGFGANCVSLRIFANAAQASDQGLAEMAGDWPYRHLLSEVLDGEVPVCGVLPSELASALFADRATQVASAALVPLRVGEHCGVLAIGHRSERHYYAGMGTLYLRQLADVLSRLLAPRVVA